MFCQGGITMYCQCLDKIRIYKGEKRKIIFNVHSSKNESFSILEASICINKYKDTIEQPKAVIDDHDISFVLDSEIYDTGKYEIEVKYSIADEKRISKFTLEVI